jgi:chromosome segregation ATPase
MIESLMFAAIGFLSASLVGAFMIAEVHRRAVRLTTRRLQISNPLITEILAAKDQQRAEYALYTARLEMTIRELRQRATSLFGELGKRNARIHRLEIELSEHAAAIAALRGALTERLRANTGEQAWEGNDNPEAAKPRLAQPHLTLVSGRSAEMQDPPALDDCVLQRSSAAG